jgi:hypothetical protein
MSAETMVDLYNSLEILCKGMLGLFAICGFIMLLIMFVSKILRSRR